MSNILADEPVFYVVYVYREGTEDFTIEGMFTRQELTDLLVKLV